MIGHSWQDSLDHIAQRTETLRIVSAVLAVEGRLTLIDVELHAPAVELHLAQSVLSPPRHPSVGAMGLMNGILRSMQTDVGVETTDASSIAIIGNASGRDRVRLGGSLAQSASDLIINNRRRMMHKAILAGAMLALSSPFAVAAEDSNATTKAMKDHPGTTGGSTATPTAKPNSGSLSEKQMQTQPGVKQR